MHDVASLQNYLLVGALLFGVGLVGFIVRRNMIVMFLCVEMMLQGVAVSLVAWGRFHGDWGGQMLVIFAIAVAACEAAIGLALILALYHQSGRLDVAFWQDLREEGQPAYVDRQIPEEPQDERAWPKLTPAGIEPAIDEGERERRRHRTAV